MHTTDSLLWLQASLMPGWGPASLRQLYDNPELRKEIFRELPRLLPDSSWPVLDECETWAGQPGNHLVGMTDDLYPPLLLQIPDPPPVLFVRGAVESLSLPQIAMVGSRKPSPDGRRHAQHFAHELSACGYVITSGLAMGIDGECHASVVARGGITIAVLGSGLDMLYPKCHASLAADIIGKQGALVSEFLPDSLPLAGNFPRRNRIISGMAHGVLVVEAALRSGSLITARLAADQGREVFSIPGSIRNPLARGCHDLIRRGAKLVESATDILEELTAILAWEESRCERDEEDENTGQMPDESGETQLLLQHLGYDPVTVDELAILTGLGIQQVAATLVLLEIGGVVAQDEGRFALSGS